MSLRKAAFVTAIALIAALAPSAAAARPFSIRDAGTFGGPQAFFNLPGYPITPRGAVLGCADTTIPDEDFPNFNPFVVGFPTSAECGYPHPRGAVGRIAARSQAREASGTRVPFVSQERPPR